MHTCMYTHTHKYIGKDQGVTLLCMHMDVRMYVYFNKWKSKGLNTM